MPPLDQPPRLAIIGFGPRGLGALEALMRHWGNAPLQIDIFDPASDPGAGPNFALDEPALCLLNIPLRAIDLPSPPGTAFPDAQSRLAERHDDANAFPPRADLGVYLSDRLNHLLRHLPATITITFHGTKAQALAPCSSAHMQWNVTADNQTHGPYTEVLLTQGQPATAPDEQRLSWQDHAASSGAIFTAAYPAKALLTAAQGWHGKSVAIRGLALSAFDMIRLLSSGLGGSFANGTYHPSSREPARILPFSLDGRPPAPKPATGALDASFDPPRHTTTRFRAACQTGVMNTPSAALDTLTAPLADAAKAVLARLGEPTGLTAIEDWLMTERESPGAQEAATPRDFLELSIAMAEGTRPPSIGYAVGQIWRKWQGILRTAYLSRSLAGDTAGALTGFDDALKRYSYGPPIRAAHELQGLIRHGLVDLRAVKDPDITLTTDGWSLEEGNDTLRADIIIDAVLPGPDLQQITDPLICGLRSSGHLTPLASGLAAATHPNGQALGRDGSTQTGLCVLGRMTQGSTIAVDSIHDCFGPATRLWAADAAQRLCARMRKS
ncbi:FAD/NAD(P)-binding protein [Rhodobacteraceae bacterium D3-12]|nr:FAD/NAD(P)-binding protein [Rhodobacteraceae bacterium D3-12]